MTTQLATAATHWGPMHGGGPGGGAWLLLLVPLFWIAVLAALFALVGRRWRRGGGAPWRMHGSAEHTLGDRYANGEIDEQEYRARLAVLREGRTP